MVKIKVTFNYLLKLTLFITKICKSAAAPSPSPGTAKFKLTLSLSIADLSLKGEVGKIHAENQT